MAEMNRNQPNPSEKETPMLSSQSKSRSMITTMISVSVIIEHTSFSIYTAVVND